MTCRPMLWIAATAAALGAVVSAPSVASAQAAAVGWDVTIDSPAAGAVVTSKELEITGTAAFANLPAQSVTVTVVPDGRLPGECRSPAQGDASMEGRQYSAVVPVLCNGPHQIQIVARNSLGVSSGTTSSDIGVAEAPGTPQAPELRETPDGGLAVSWESSSDPDSAGTVLQVNGQERLPGLGAGIVETTLPPADRRADVSVRFLRWGAGGPGSTPVSSDYSIGRLLDPGSQHRPTPPPPPDETDPSGPEPPPSDPPPALPGPTGPAGPGGTAPSGTTSSTGPPTRGTGATSTTLPEGYSEELPFGTPDDAFVPGAEPNRRPDSKDEERAVAAAEPVSGLVRTTERRAPGLVAPFAIGLLMITVAAHIAWYLRRSRPTGGGQVRPS